MSYVACNHTWMTDGLNPTRCTTCGVLATSAAQRPFPCPMGCHCYHSHSGAWHGINPPSRICCKCGQSEGTEHGPHLPWGYRVTALDLAAVCARHDVQLEPWSGGWDALWPAGPEEGWIMCERHATKEDAVCALLKARYALRTSQAAGAWWALEEPGLYDAGPTELAAVVALADRLATPTPEAGC